MEDVEKIKGIVKRKETEIKNLDQENFEVLKKLENLMMLIKQEEYLTQVLEDKTEHLQEHFTKMQPYMILCNKTFSKLASGGMRRVKSYRSENFYQNQDKKFQLQRLISDNELIILNKREEYQIAVKKLKKDHIVSSQIEEKFTTLCENLETRLKNEIPELCTFFTHERYDDEESDKEQSEVNKENSVIYFDTELKESFRKINKNTGESGASGIFYRQEYQNIPSGERNEVDFYDDESGSGYVTNIKDYLNFKKEERFGSD